MCPVRPSEVDGKGTDVCPAGKPGPGEGRSKTGVVNASVTKGDEDEEGVEACSVASKSGAGEEEGVKRLHPKTISSEITIQTSFVLFIPFN